MANTIKVRAVEGRLCPYEGKRGYVGYREAVEDDDVHHVIPRYLEDTTGKRTEAHVRLTRTDDVIEVPDTVYYRRACSADVGDLERVSDEAPLRNALTTAPSEGN